MVDDRNEYETVGEFVEFMPPERLVFTWSWVKPADGVKDTLVTIDFIDRGAETEIVINHERLPSEKSRDNHQKGWNGCLDSLAAFAR